MAVRQFSPMGVRRIPGPMPRVIAPEGGTPTPVGPRQGGAAYIELFEAIRSKKNPSRECATGLGTFFRL